jgi:hypothetical protein
LVDEYFNDSTGEGDFGETDAQGPWNSGGEWKIRELDDLKQGVENRETSQEDVTDIRSSRSILSDKKRKSA